MTHHNRPGGRALELLLLFGLLAISFATIGALSFLPMTGRAGKLVLAMLVIAPVWKIFLGYYKYDAKTLKPLKDDKETEHDSDNH